VASRVCGAPSSSSFQNGLLQLFASVASQQASVPFFQSRTNRRLCSIIEVVGCPRYARASPTGQSKSHPPFQHTLFLRTRKPSVFHSDRHNSVATKTAIARVRLRRLHARYNLECIPSRTYGTRPFGLRCLLGDASTFILFVQEIRRLQLRR
jgi:hypothetical protein